MAAGGAGIARHHGRAVFVDGVAPGDAVEVEPERGHGGATWGRVVRIIERSPARVAPACPYFDGCGGCPWMHLSAEAQARAKETIFYETLQRLGGIDVPSGLRRPLVPAVRTVRYRRRVRLTVRGRSVGFMGTQSHRLADIEHCLALEPALDDALGALRQALSDGGPMVGLDRVGFVSGLDAVAASFHFAKAPPPSVLSRIEALGFPALVLAGEREAHRFGDPNIPIGQIGSVRLYGRPDLFAQAHEEQNQQLASLVRDQVPERGAVLELFSGSGNLTFLAAGRADEVTAVEESIPAVELARRSAREGGISNVRFVVGDAIRLGTSLAREKRFCTVLLDPPRGGAPGISRVAEAAASSTVVYVSCDPATLARDARELVRCGFHPAFAQPIDMFPQTPHVEGILVFRG